jgi:hypothetical protein
VSSPDGWTGLLLWADHAPVQRRGALALTLVVLAGLVLAGLVLAGARAVADGLVDIGRLAPIAVVQLDPHHPDPLALHSRTLSPGGAGTQGM